MHTQAYPLLHVLRDMPAYNRLYELLMGGEGPASAFGLPQSARAHVFAGLTAQRSGLLVTATEQGAAQLYEQASALCAHVALFPAREIPLVNAYASAGEGQKTRIATLMRLALGETVGVITSVQALMQRLAPPDALRGAVFSLTVGEEAPPATLLSRLFDAGYELVELVEGPGQAALRGDILDIYPLHAPAPYRIEFFDDEVDRISVYDPVSQRSIEPLTDIVLPPATEAPQDKHAIARANRAIANAKGFDAQKLAFEHGRAAIGAEALLNVLYEKTYTLLDHLPANALLLVDEPNHVDEAAQSAQRLFAGSIAAMLERQEGLAAQADLQQTADEAIASLATPRTALLFTLARSYLAIRARETVQFDARSAPPYQEDRQELASDIRRLLANGAAVLIYAGSHAKRVQQQLLDAGCETGFLHALTRPPVHGEALVLEDSLPQGVIYPEARLHIYTETELFGVRRKAGRARHSDKPRLVFSQLKPGDYVVHEAHGIGRFIGVEALTVQDTTRDYLLMQYLGGDQLYIPTDQLDRVQKYVGGEEVPKLNKLGGSEWQRQVARAKSAVKELAFDLAKLYMARENSRGFAFSEDTAWQREFEERFPYTETPDQLHSIEQIKQDMQSNRVMDRLLCGDVGYGKTEVALRAAFKAVQDSKQVAVLVPTTVLAQQHYSTLSTRFDGFPVKVGMLSRFRSAQENKATKQALQNGMIDIVVGTHALLAKDVRFKDLGLLIVDEEQRFGVGHKEQIKTMKENVDVLTLSATPIPRTLHMSMVGIRDMSIIDTPPEERYPVQTYVLEYSDTLLTDALQKEVSRGGQCYVVYNQVRRLEQFRERLMLLLPDARIAVGHGQMPEQALERVMLDFMRGEVDVLLCSTIVENGLDIQNANTLFVLDADKMGLSQLYQLRGRVGRSSRLGYAYFTFQRDKSISETAHRRLSALTEFAQFGAGREIALRDLEIRGAGSLLGAQQHGHIADIGFEYYCKLMNAAAHEAKGEPAPFDIDVVVDIPLDAHIPKTYISSEVQRLTMYKRIALIADTNSMLDVQEELEDRYGNIPISTQNLMDIALAKAACNKAQVAHLSVREGMAKLLFHEEAALDGGMLLAAALQYGAQLIPGDVISLVYQKQSESVAAVLHGLMPLLTALGACGQ